MGIFNKKIVSSMVIFTLIFGFGKIFNKAGFVDMINIVLADDENDDAEETDEGEYSQIINTNPEERESSKVETRTISTRLSDTVTQTTTTTTKHDSDGDGIYDDDDSHPTINDNFIVKDANFNGIDDRYEQ